MFKRSATLTATTPYSLKSIMKKPSASKKVGSLKTENDKLISSQNVIKAGLNTKQLLIKQGFMLFS